MDPVSQIRITARTRPSLGGASATADKILQPTLRDQLTWLGVPFAGTLWFRSPECYFARVQVCDLQITLITQPLSSAEFGPVRVSEPE